MNRNRRTQALHGLAPLQSLLDIRIELGSFIRFLRILLLDRSTGSLKYNLQRSPQLLRHIADTAWRKTSFLHFIRVLEIVFADDSLLHEPDFACVTLPNRAPGLQAI